MEINFNKSYSSKEEEDRKKNIFDESLKTISNHNLKFDSKESSFKMGINQFADKNIDDFNQMVEIKPFVENKLFEAVMKKEISFKPLAIDIDDNATLPSSYDWRNYGAVTKVKDQKDCGICYTIAALGSLESHIFIKTGNLLELSIQEILDCGESYNTFGCDGGIGFRVFDYIKDKGISLENDYPFTRSKKDCDLIPKRLKFPIKGYFRTVKNDETMLKRALVSMGPLLVNLASNHESFMRYSSGIYYDPSVTSNDNITHSLLLVGYGSDDDIDYWIIKNSFGEAWGANGYIKLAINNRNNHMRTAFSAVCPVLDYNLEWDRAIRILKGVTIDEFLSILNFSENVNEKTRYQSINATN
ncbi:CLUMA_CG013650, isoform A [Clunio marinus]|uniref:CLUMA_CG013650, isoform A n=1 Tax=Clunio marinus TaxID=568069 RepID=A0A1J1IMR4_9DIPT|nr:CLUMA_CG013650, isoform A [Clunio marinus]